MTLRQEINNDVGKRMKRGLHNYRLLLKNALKAGNTAEVERIQRRIAEREQLLKVIKK